VIEVDPAAFDQAVQRRIERPLLDAQHIVGAALDRFDDFVSVGRARPQDSQDQDVERALQQLDPRSPLLVDILGESRQTHLGCQGE
jgi:hypothetical protein